MAAAILAYEGLGLVQGEGWLLRGLDVHIGARDRLALANDPHYHEIRAQVLEFLYKRHQRPAA